jgi:putrescine aminotransferase
LVIRELLVTHRIMTAYTLNCPNTLRLQPPLNVTTDQIEEVVGALDKALRCTRRFAPVAVRSMTALTRAQFTAMGFGAPKRSL